MVLPAALLAVTTYAALAAAAVGVPEIIPVEVLRLSPAGRVGDTEYVTIAPPLLLGVLDGIAVPIEYTAGLTEYVRLLGAITPVFTVMLRPAVALPATLVAVTTYAVAGVTVVGVPEMAPLAVLRLRPVGSAGDTEYVAIAPPLLLGVLVEMAVPAV